MRLATLAWRSLLARPLRAGLTVGGVALGVAVVTATLIAGQAADQAVRSAVAELLGRAELRVRAFADVGFTPRAVQALRSLAGVRAGAAVAERRLTLSAEPDRVFSVLVIGIDPEADRAIRDPNLVDGVPISADSPTDALVPARWAIDHGLGIGDRLLLTGARPGVPPLRIVGLMSDTGFAALDGGNVLVMSRLPLDEAFEVPAPVRYVDLDVFAGAEGDVRAALDTLLTEPFVVESADDAAAHLGQAQSGFAAIAFLFGLVALVVGAFLVGNTLAMSVGERIREIGLLRAAGATAGQVRGLVVRQGLSIGVVGGAVGLLLGIGLAAAMIGFLSSSRAVLIDGLPLGPASLALAVALGLLVTLAGSLLPAQHAARVSPLEALRPSLLADRGLTDRLRWLVVVELLIAGGGLILYPVQRGGPVLPLILSLGLLVGGALAAAYLLAPLGRVVGRPFEWFFGAEGLLGRANLTRDRTRTGLTVGALMIGLAAVVALGTVAESARVGAQRWVESILPGGHAIRLGLAVDVEQFRPTFAATPGLLVATPIRELPAVIREPDVDAQREVSLAGIEPNAFQDSGALVVRGAERADGFAALRDGGAIMVPAPLAERLGVGVGDVLAVGQPGREPIDFQVAGVLEYTLPARSPDGALLISDADARDLFGATTASLWAMVPQPGIPPIAFEAAVRDTAASLAGQALTAQELAGDLTRALGRLIGLFDALALVAVVVGALGIVNTLSLGVSERVREIAILRSHGMTVGQVQAMVVAEAAIMGAIGGLLAVVTGIGVAWGLVGAAAHDLGAGLQPPWPLLAAVVLLGVGVAALGGLYPARVAGSLPIMRHLKQFE